MKNLAIGILVFLLLSSCVRYEIDVNTYGNDSHLDKKNYTLIFLNKEKLVNEFEINEYKSYIQSVLKEKGYQYVEDSSLANVIISANYGISDPIQYESLVTIPLFGQTGISSSETTGTISYNSRTGSSEIKEKTNYTPSYGVTGYNSYTQTNILYLRFLHLNAYDYSHFKKTKTHKQIWQAQINSSGYSDDLRILIPAMLIASKSYLGKSSGSKVKKTVWPMDRRLKKLKSEGNK